MGRCHEFGSQIREGCSHPMRAGERACACPECGVVCQGQFDGCPDVWARGPRPITLTMAPAIDAPRVRALASGPPPAPAAPSLAPPPSMAPPPASNGNRNGYTNAAPPPPPPPPPPRAEPQEAAPGSSAGSRTQVLQWFEDAFDDLRNELHAVVSSVTRQQAMLAELLDSREAELRVVMVAESLPELAGEAAAKALADQSDGLAEIVAASLDDFRATMLASELSGTAVMDGMRELLRRVEVTAEVNVEEARLDGIARLDALKASVGRQLRPVSAAVAELAAHMEMAEEREAARAKALKASVTRQIQPLTAAVEAAVARSDQQLAEIRARLDALTAPTKAVPKKAVAATSKAATSKAAAKRTAAKRTVAKRTVAKPAAAPKVAVRAPKRRVVPPAGESSPLYDYESPPAPPAGGLLARRKPTRRPPVS
ncbi:MAG: hypothetical protein ACR2KK_00455 [Acidimicrobiales bacterium]